MARVKSQRSPYRKFGSLRILRDGRVRISPWTFPGLSQLQFTAVHGSTPDPANYSIHGEWDRETIFILYVTRHRVDTVCFAYTLSADALRNAIAVMRAAANGLERWIIPALEWTRRDLAQSQPNPDWERLKAAIPEALESVQGLPVAPQWRKRLRILERRDPAPSRARSEGARPARKAVRARE